MAAQAGIHNRRWRQNGHGRWLWILAFARMTAELPHRVMPAKAGIHKRRWRQNGRGRWIWILAVARMTAEGHTLSWREGAHPQLPTAAARAPVVVMDPRLREDDIGSAAADARRLVSTVRLVYCRRPGVFGPQGRSWSGIRFGSSGARRRGCTC